MAKLFKIVNENEEIERVYGNNPACCYCGFYDEDEDVRIFDNYFVEYMNETYGHNKWRGIEEENERGGFFEYLYEEENVWIPLNVYHTEWDN